MNLSWAGTPPPPLPFNPQSEPFSKFLQGAGILALNLPPSPQVVGHVLQLLGLLLKLHI